MKILLALRGNPQSAQAVLEAALRPVEEVYLSVLNSRYSSGRTYVHGVGFEELQQVCRLAEAAGSRTLVAFNTPCLGGKETSPQFQEEFREFLREIKNAGAAGVILSSPFLMELTKRFCPELSVTVSVFSEVDSPEKLKYYQDLGADRITLPHELNRDLEKLKAFRAAADMELEVIANLACLHYCARADAHCRYVGHSTAEILRESAGDYYVNWCDTFRLSRPWEVLSGNFIRPEDLYRYREIGIDYLKIAGRATSASWIIRAIRAYQQEKYQGNLLDLLTQFYPYTARNSGKPPFYLPNPELTPYMDYLYRCPKRCWECDWCRRTFARLTSPEGKRTGMVTLQ